MTVENEQLWTCPCQPHTKLKVTEACAACRRTFQDLLANWPDKCPSQTTPHNHHMDYDPAWAEVMGGCGMRPCPCQHALISGCSCGLYVCPILRRTAHHTTDCKIFEKGLP